MLRPISVNTFQLILSRFFIEDIGPTEKQNWDRLVGSRVCTSTPYSPESDNIK